MDANITPKPKARPLQNGAWTCYGSGRTAAGMSLREAYMRWRDRIEHSPSLYYQTFGRARRVGLTATPLRLDSTDFDHTVRGPTIEQLKRGGFL